MDLVFITLNPWRMTGMQRLVYHGTLSGVDAQIRGCWLLLNVTLFKHMAEIGLSVDSQLTGEKQTEN